ncbi:helix-turn-helix domain-containing protein [Aerococcus sp. Group 1]|uniref:helix-turn-helix domain-containing protein n=1 Tax=Aerococcus urinae (strain CCUG 59500 / ACS-120-V-Col10a) TaxID=2976812 RepID=UPI000200FD69|nr:Rgg/GadR/MutR family transcriptional regulator [Aerococcus sp. Group 1]AEA00806.1 transcriptional activator, Rgg/GadR/MutR family domain protein [Aerococcus sp. Group 1]MCY3031135.1 Rgg/GadR/MutR family transcriptional regulator [Aerococcus sp. Group 1]MCY3054229.1 Rgg/GadR/MutR family transcriptional regulator [Aerococcus sp. Group 1]MCY3055959.1 Rgg/GadR/MutR family transcriptional regulator [Aerococcus sp. Group 1]MCY3061895.1 Rgg/GadR/MutR family transcriptional regulator [Aerococcus sp
MKELGQIFKQLREAKHITLSEASGGDFSASMLSKFENGKNEISAHKLFTALDNTHIEVNEYLYLARGFSESQLVKLQENILDFELHNDRQALKKLYLSEVQKWQKAPQKKSHKINSIIIKAHMKALDDTTTLSDEESAFLHDYLFSTEIWGNYELTLLSISSTLISSELFTQYTHEMLHKSDCFGGLKSNRRLIHTLLINGFLLCIDVEDYVNAAYFDKQIQNHFFKENETYYRIIYLWAKGLYAYKLNGASEGIDQMKTAIAILKTLHCDNVADYYQKAMNKELSNRAY